jgi:hypothetical protein
MERRPPGDVRSQDPDVSQQLEGAFEVGQIREVDRRRLELREGG